MPSITANMVVKNEDQWVYFAVNSILPYVDKFLVTDTGSTDQTLAILKNIKDPKLEVKTVKADSRADITRARQAQLAATKTDWIWLVDGDEIYPDSLVKEILSAINSQKYEGIVVRRYDLLGDIYNRQIESVGSYSLFGQTGHLVTRLLSRKKIKGLHLQGDYPLEGFYDDSNQSTRSRDPKNWYITRHSLYHAMYLKRSSLGRNLSLMPNRSKYKLDKGITVIGKLPEVFIRPTPSYVPNPLSKRGLLYELAAAIITPVKNLYRRFK